MTHYIVKVWIFSDHTWYIFDKNLKLPTSFSKNVIKFTEFCFKKYFIRGGLRKWKIPLLGLALLSTFCKKCIFTIENSKKNDKTTFRQRIFCLLRCQILPHAMTAATRAILALTWLWHLSMCLWSLGKGAWGAPSAKGDPPYTWKKCLKLIFRPFRPKKIKSGKWPLLTPPLPPKVEFI